MNSEQDNIEEVANPAHFGIPGPWTLISDEEIESEAVAGDSEDKTTSDTADTIAASNASAKGVFHFKELMAAEIERPKAIVEGLVCERQNVLLMGRFGVGKTMFGTQLSLHLATGREFLGLKIPNACRVAYLDLENDLGDMKNRISKQADSLKLSTEEKALLDANWHYLDAGDDKNPLHDIKLDAYQEKFEPLLAALKNLRPNIVIIDNLGLVATQGDLTDPKETAQFYSNLTYIRSRVPSLQNGAFIVFHHITKPGEYSNSISLLTQPYEYLSRARGSGKVLDSAKSRLALAEETVGSKKCHVVNGINRSASVSPLILQFNSDTLSFDRHEDTKFRFDAVFATRPRGKEIYRLLSEEFTFSDAAKVSDPTTGKLLNKGTLSDTLKIAVENDFLRHDLKTGIYSKVFDFQSE